MAAVLTIICLALACLLACPVTGHAAERMRVDVELVLAVDVSRSMMAEELALQRRGYVEALADPDIGAILAGGRLGRVALTYVEWSGAGDQIVVVPWRVLASPRDAEAFSDELANAAAHVAFRTSISAALDAAVALIASNDIDGERRIIDISGDGANNDGEPVTLARDRALEQGITINGLPLVTGMGLGGRVEVQEVDQYYRDCVIGGPGAFSMPVRDWEQFGQAVKHKLALELSALPLPSPAAHPFPVSAGFDCLAGEKLWKLQNGKS
jgi:hypothetical protein